MLVAEFELHPFDSKYNEKVKLSVRPIQVTYDKDTVDEVISMFRLPRTVRLQKFSSSATATLKQLRTQSRAGLEHSISMRRLIDIDVTLSSPVLVIPEGGILSEEACKLILDPGTLRVTSDIKHLVPDVKVSERGRRYSFVLLLLSYFFLSLLLFGDLSISTVVKKFS